MGGNGSKSGQSDYPQLSKGEYSRLETFFKTACEKQEFVSEKNHENLWSDLADKSLVNLLITNIFKTEKTIRFGVFIQPYITIVHGSVEEKTRLLCSILTNSENSVEAPAEAIIDYVYKILSSFIIQMRASKNKDLLSWQAEKFDLKDENVRLFADYLCSGLPQKTGALSMEVLEKWIFTWSRIAALEKSVFRKLYSVEPDEIEACMEVKFVPRCVMHPRPSSHPSILDIGNILFLNSSLPVELRDQWRFLFSVTVHGFSFAKLMDRIIDKGPSIIIIEDKEGHVFGGFAPHSWKLSPNFAGDGGNSFLFTLNPRANMYFPSGYNNHFQYMNVQQQTFPNGLGMGGQYEYFGLWLDAEFGKGHCSESCTTYKDYKMMSGSKHFELNHVEVWGLGPEPKKSDDEKQKKSILDQDLQAQALLEIAGKTYNSDGYRDPMEEEK